MSLVGADEVVYTKKIPNESRIRFAKDEVTGKLYFVVDVVDSPYVTFTAEEDNSSIGLNKLSRAQTLEYSTDTTTWNAFDTTTNIPLNNGDKLYVRGILLGDNTTSRYTHFKMSGKIAASGNCNAIWNYEDLNAPLKAYCGYKMFYDCTSLTTAPELPATTLTDHCYNYMFSHCYGLTIAPELPATKLAPYCYKEMFQYCGGLTTAPYILPANELAIYCYSFMFYKCSSLTSAPELPATELADSCYSSMFWYCTSLTTAPKLPATTANYYCYSGMFSDCTSLTKAPELPATVLDKSCYGGMFRNCTSLTTTPELPATELAESCYGGMFYGCTSLTTVPELPATNLAKSCYQSMFNGCTNLNYIKCLATGVSIYNSTNVWVEGVSSTGTFVKHSDMNNWTTGVNGIPEGWTVQDAILAE